jgi:hypothetical protein
LSPGDSVLVMAASQPAVPEPGKTKTWPAGLEHFLEIGKQGQGEFGKIGSPLVLELDGHGLAHPFGDVGRARNKQSGISGFHVPQSLSKSSG